MVPRGKEKSGKERILDSHVHLDFIERYRPHRIEWLKEAGCAVVSWAYCEGADSVSRLEACLKSKGNCIKRHAQAGLACHYLAGVHPRSIPPDLEPGQIGPLLHFSLEDPLCKGIGEIGLEKGDSKEELKRIISMGSDRMDRIMCNTDSGDRFYEDVVQLSRDNDLPEAARKKLFYGNGARFFSLSY